ncbi:hypothetical protein [Vreelandella venusta]|uniref:hypothetical protein n=1 Tax=Vreelandella venusta TaxID=44935 RepID=UPI00116C207A|nr:hypothetical protein [Halomonas venusta]GEK52322.1 hypothetical protein HVE01_30430 [Halomonas venusta]
MVIKNKPMNFSTPDIEKFRSHDPEKANEETNTLAGSNARITKTVRMRERFSLLLKDEAHKRTMKSGAKVSEADLLDEALSAWQLKIQAKQD